MSRNNSSNRTSLYLANVQKVIETAKISNTNTSISAAVLSLAEMYLGFNPSITSNVECYSPIFFLHTLWCEPNSQGIEKATEELETFLEVFNAADRVGVLNSLRNVLCAAKQVPSIQEDLRDPCNINNLINSALLYACLTSANWCDIEEWNCLDVFLCEAWDANNEEKQKVAANQLQGYIENASLEPSESILEALYEGRITTPNTLYDEV